MQFTTNNSRLLSIVIPCKNEEKQLQQTLTAIEQQSFDMANCPIYIADAGSSDRPLDIIADFQKNTCLDIQVVEGGYPPAGRNNGARHKDNRNYMHVDF